MPPVRWSLIFYSCKRRSFQHIAHFSFFLLFLQTHCSPQALKSAPVSVQNDRSFWVRQIWLQNYKSFSPGQKKNNNNNALSCSPIQLCILAHCWTIYQPKSAQFWPFIILIYRAKFVRLWLLSDRQFLGQHSIVIFSHCLHTIYSRHHHYCCIWPPPLPLSVADTNCSHCLVSWPNLDAHCT